jgi:hypothetical protein
MTGSDRKEDNDEDDRQHSRYFVQRRIKELMKIINNNPTQVNYHGDLKRSN